MAEEGQTDVPSVDSPGESTSSPPSPKLSPVSPASIPPSAPSEGYRELILKRMHERNLKSRQFESVYKSFEFVVDQLQRQRRQRVTRTESVGSANLNNDQVENLRLELADVYKKKSINDQCLLESNRSLEEMKKRLDKITKEKDDLAVIRDKLYARIAELETSLRRAEDDRNNARDEHLALTANYQAISDKLQEQESDRIQLVQRIKELQEKQADFFNAEVEHHREIQNERIRKEIEAALAEVPNTYEDLCPIGDDVPEQMGDILPTNCAAKFEANEGEVTSIAWLGTELFATGGSDKMVRVYRAKPGGQIEKISTLAGCNQTVTRLDWDPVKRAVLASSNDKTARVWNIDTGRLMVTFSDMGDKVSAARFLQNDQIIAGSFDRTIKLFDARNGKTIKSFFPGSSVLDVAAFGTFFISGHMDKKIRLWDGRRPEPVRTVEMGGRVTSLDIAIDQLSFVCSMRDDTLASVDIRSFVTLHNYGSELYRTSTDMSRCVISPLQEHVAAGSVDGKIFVWQTNTTKLETRLSKKGHENAVQAVAWNPSGRGLLSSDKQKTVCLWL
ncbi:atg-16.1 [Pristionchus pacificus]|uniref:Atg-16.1 n=1 Tax=Pristionchus pacificus TaxID=54126 RepID=A0A2A6CZP1_PRIPA|nr:atg-16.1 [Pristionchus pacificus]|eukprot:PDM83598.1 atg-16.1 [Pristionchus pacificus]